MHIFEGCHEAESVLVSNGVFLINRPSELSALVFMNWNSLVCEHERGLKFLSQSGAWEHSSYSLLRMCIAPVQNVIIACAALG